MNEEIKNSSLIINYSLVHNFFKQSLEILKNKNDFIKSYIEIKKDYNKKLLNLKIKYSKTINEKNNINFDSLISDINNNLNIILQKEIESNILLIEGIEKTIEENNIIINNNKIEEKTLIKNFSTEVQEIIDYKTDVNKLKNNFHNNTLNLEKLLINDQLEKKILTSSTKIILPNDIDNKLISESIEKMKKSENDYINLIEKLKIIENKFVKNAKEYYENEKEKASNILFRLKEIIINLLLYLKNSFQIPYLEIENFSKNTYNNDIKLKYENLLNSLLKKNESFNYTKYINYNFICYEDKLDYIKDLYLKSNELNVQEKFNIIQFVNSNLKVKHNLFDENVEKEIIIVNNIMNKILNFNQKNYNPPNQNEIDNIINLCKKKENILVVLNKLNKFRANGNFKLPKDIFDLFAKIMNNALDYLNVDNDMNTIGLIIILSMTYYNDDNNNKIFLYKKIFNNKIFKEQNFWEKFLDYKIKKSLNDKINKNNHQNIVFGHIITIIDNLLEFGNDINFIKKIIDPTINLYNLDENFKLSIEAVLHSKKPTVINDNIEDEENKKNK